MRRTSLLRPARELTRRRDRYTQEARASMPFAVPAVEIMRARIFSIATYCRRHWRRAPASDAYTRTGARLLHPYMFAGCECCRKRLPAAARRRGNSRHVNTTRPPVIFARFSFRMRQIYETRRATYEMRVVLILNVLW